MPNSQHGATSDLGGGPLKGIRIVEFMGVGPGPFCAMLLADMGAEVISIDRTTPHGLGFKKEPRFNPLLRNRRSLAVDLKSSSGRDVALRLLGQADALIEGNRPGVMERLGLGPDECLKINPRLVYGRMTGWGQQGPLAGSVGHDLNYLAMSGALSLIGSRDRGPAIPLNLLGDFGGGGLYLALGIVSAILEARTSGQGQVVDAAMIDGIGSLMTNQFGYAASGQWVFEREANFIDGGAPWYNVYETKDGKYVSIASVERKFYDQLLLVLGLDSAELPDQLDRSRWPEMRERFADIFRSKTRNEWCDVMEGAEACFAPVLGLDEAVAHPQMRARNCFVDVDGVTHPAPAPRFSRTPSSIRRGAPTPGENTAEVMSAWGFSDAEVTDFRGRGAIMWSGVRFQPSRIGE
jgi:alpha-methylacyl-CoA racemase